ncbi:unnamed protein product [Sphenostylis stenocarpa]|uniref:Uncharacterized protein n=1 Tax=Sphenostylis stenocarpa TaxID=92480 RepID=A0AA86S2P9_9FABA|nr:unnamed protein product [Sphenostylis stenocarpa]
MDYHDNSLGNLEKRKQANLIVQDKIDDIIKPSTKFNVAKNDTVYLVECFDVVELDKLNLKRFVEQHVANVIELVIATLKVSSLEANDDLSNQEVVLSCVPILSKLTFPPTNSHFPKSTTASLLFIMPSSTCSATTTITITTSNNNNNTLCLNSSEKCKMSKKEGSSSTTSPLMKNSSSQRKCAFARKCARLVKEQRARFYIMRRCVIMLICWHDTKVNGCTRDIYMFGTNKGPSSKDVVSSVKVMLLFYDFGNGRLAQTLTMASQAIEQHMDSQSLGHDISKFRKFQCDILILETEILKKKEIKQVKGNNNPWVGPVEKWLGWAQGHGQRSHQQKVATCWFGIGAWGKEEDRKIGMKAVLKMERVCDVSAKQRHSDTAHAH